MIGQATQLQDDDEFKGVRNYLGTVTKRLGEIQDEMAQEKVGYCRSCQTYIRVKRGNRLVKHLHHSNHGHRLDAKWCKSSGKRVSKVWTGQDLAHRKNKEYERKHGTS